MNTLHYNIEYSISNNVNIHIYIRSEWKFWT